MKLDKDFVAKTDENIGELQTIMGDLERLAVQDGKFTNDEILLLNSVKNNLQSYNELLERVIEDEVITREEYDQMKSMEEKLIKDAEMKAMDDDFLSFDERNILAMLKKLLGEIGTLKFK